MRDRIRLRFGLWCAAVALLLGYSALAVWPRLKIETDVLALLPAVERDAGLEQALQQAAQAFSRRTLFLVGAADAASAKRIALEFAASLRASTAFSEVRAEREFDADVLQIYAPARFGLLSRPQAAWLAAGDVAAFKQDAARALYAPMAFQPLPLAQDPFNLLGGFLAGQLAAAGGARLEDGVLVVSDAQTRYVLIAAESRDAPYSLSAQAQLMPVIETAIRRARTAGAQVISSGLVLHAHAAAQSAQREISAVGTLSLLGVLALVFFTFRSLTPLLLNLGVVGLGTLAAIVVCHHLFDRIHIITLVFGASLIGVAMDYSTHFLADQFRRGPGWTPRAALAHVGPGILMGMACAVTGYAGLALAPLPGLRQMAVFSAVGLICACASVLLAFPVLAQASRRKDEPLILRAARALDARLGARRLPAWGLVLATLAVGAGLWRMQFNDDVRLLQNSPPALIEQERALRELLPATPDSRFFFVRGDSHEQLLQAQERLGQKLDALVARGTLHSWQGLARALPSAQTQQRNRELLAQAYREQGVLPELMGELGFPPAVIAQRLSEFRAAPPALSAADFLRSAPGEPYRALMANGGALVMLAGVKDVAALQALDAPQTRFIDKVAESSALLTRYRQLATALLAGAYLLIGLLLALRYGARAAPRMLAVPLLAALGTLAALSLLGEILSLFTALGLMMVLGLGVDYTIFLRESPEGREVSVLAITLSTLGTLLAYGLLAFSATPFIQMLGLTLLIGIALTYFLALMLSPAAKTPPASP